MRELFAPWDEQALQILSSFRRDFVRSTQAPDIAALVKELEKASPDFKALWRRQDINDPCQGIRHLQIEGVGRVVLEHTTLTIDEDRHLRLVYYAAKEGMPQSRDFEQWLQQEPVLV